MRHNNRPAAPFHDIENGANGLIDSKGVFDESFFDHIMVATQKDYFIVYIGVLQQRKFRIKLCWREFSLDRYSYREVNTALKLIGIN